ncbi:sensor histidine kinase [Anaerosacchariphilus polymeriproducens]|nr:HAMP domain-containing sensor histidine kinase [Anaerosacchariphilus polymeriproducens]
MINSLKKKLILLFTGFTGVVFTIVLVIIFINTEQRMINNQRLTFQNIFWSVIMRIDSSNVISDAWLTEMLENEQIFIQIEANGNKLICNQLRNEELDFVVAVKKLKKKASQEHVNTNVVLVSQNKVQSKIYEVNGKDQERYLGQIYITSTENGNRSIIVLKKITKSKKEIERQCLFFVGMDAIGIFLFYLISRWIIGKALLPVEENNRRHKQFIAAASHELKSPLAVIRVNSSAIQLEPAQTEHFVTVINNECERASKLIEDLLFLANANARNWTLEVEFVDIEDVLIVTYDTFVSVCKERGKRLQLDLPDEILPKVRGDEYRLKQILVILIDNAISYSKDGDIIILRAYTKKGSLYVEVQDHGNGVQSSKKEEIFECFYREDKARKDRNHYGLGLTIAKELVELHSGKIYVKDTPGGGATFGFILPDAGGKNRIS